MSTNGAVPPGIAVSGDRRLRDPDDEGDPDDKLTFTPLGAGQEVGRSCHLLQFKGKNILLDCGIHPGMGGGIASLPFLTHIEDAEKIDLVLITHFHLDHIGALLVLLRSGRIQVKIPPHGGVLVAVVGAL